MISGCSFVGNKASGDGAAVRLESPLSVLFEDNTFTSNEAANGAALAFTCNDDYCEVDLSSNTFQSNHASLSGGAIIWTTIEPMNVLDGNTYSGNTAGEYGPNISAPPQKLVEVLNAAGDIDRR